MSVFRGILLGLVAVCFLGCGGDDGRKSTYGVTGVVKMAGAPIPGATVMFAPTEGQPVASGITDDNGKYQLTTYETGDGAVAGAYNVLVIRAAEKKAEDKELDHDAFSGDGDPTSSAHDAEDKSDEASSSLPRKYADAETTDLLATVEAKSENVIDLTLEP